MIKKVLIANRGEIALRILRACRDLDIETVAVHSTVDADSMHVRLADESVCIGPAPSSASYLNKQALLTAADISGADAVHPGVGFLSENADFAEMVEAHGMTFIGPTPEHINMMGDKVEAKRAAIAAGLPVVPGSEGEIDSVEEALEVARTIGYPVIVKAVSGGGGRGMQVVEKPTDLGNAISLASTEAKAAFGNAAVYLEKYLGNPRHIEVQVLGDSYGNAVHFGERDCSIQRRHQKLFEEARSPGLTDDERDFIGELARKATQNLGYRGAGTYEFLYENGKFYFMEMNTRIQVEHPISEMITRRDLVKLQLQIASGLPLPMTQDEVTFVGHSIECRINAEHPETFVPSPGTVTDYHAPGGMGVRVDSHLFSGYTIPPHYDSLVSKLIVFAPDRAQCLQRLRRALKEYAIGGINTLIPLHQKLVDHPTVQDGSYTIKWLEEEMKAGRF